MAVTIIASTPVHNAVLVKSFPAVIELIFSEEVNRGLVESGIKLDPAENLSFRWSTVNAVIPGSGTYNTAGTMVTRDVLKIVITGQFQSHRPYKLTLPAANVKSKSNVQMQSDYLLTFHTRPFSVETPPSNAVGGGSRKNIPPGGYKRAIVLSGGGAKGDFQVGAVKYLYEKSKFFPDLIVGTSVGAVNGVKLAEATTEQEHLATIADLEQLWLNLRSDNDIYTKQEAFKKLVALLNAPNALAAAYDNVGYQIASAIPFLPFQFALDEIEDSIEAHMVALDNLQKSPSLYTLSPLKNNWLVAPKLNATKVFNSNVELVLGTVELYKGQTYWYSKKDANGSAASLVNFVMASALMPGVFETIRMGDKVFTDGGVKEVAGLAQAILLGANDIVVIPTYKPGGWPYQPRLNETRYNALESILGRTLTELVFDEMLSNDIFKTIDKQTLLNYYKGEEVRIRVIDPNIEIHGSTSFHPEGIRRGIEHGYMRASHVLDGLNINTPVPHPIEHSRTANYLVIEPTFADGTVLPDHRVMFPYTGGLSEPLNTSSFEDVRIIIHEKGRLVHTYPSDKLWGYGDIVVPGSDPDLTSSINPYLKGRRKGLFYAFPIHSKNDGQYLGASSGSAARKTVLDVQVIFSVLTGSGGYKSVAKSQQVTFTPDANGIMRVPVKFAENKPSGGKSRCVILAENKESASAHPPAITFHGFGEISDIKKLAGTDGSLGIGRWECSRKAELMPDLRGLHVLRDGITVHVWDQPNFTGNNKKITSDSDHQIPFAVRSIRIGMNI